MATVKKYKDRIELYLSVEEVARAWAENPSWFKSPVQVAADKGMQALNLAGKVATVQSEWVKPYFKITYKY